MALIFLINIFKGDNWHLSGLDLPKTEANIKMFISTVKVSSFKLVSTGFVTSVCVCVQNLLHCSWSPDGSKVAGGSGDRFVYVWDTTSRRITYKLPGHAGSVNDVDFHPFEPICKLCGPFVTIL